MIDPLRKEIAMADKRSKKKTCTVSARVHHAGPGDDHHHPWKSNYAIFDYLDEALVILDCDGIVLLFNEAAAKLSQGLFKPIRKGGPLNASTNLETSLIIKNIIEEVELTRTPGKHLSRVRNRNGSMVFLEFNFVPITNETNVKTNIHLSIRDVTAQKVFEKKLITQATNITNLIEGANAVIIGLDTRGYITDWNEHCIKITGFAKNEVFAQKFATNLMKNIGDEKFNDIVDQALRCKPSVNRELMICSKVGKLITLLLSATPRLSTSDQVIGLTLIGQDITELAEYRLLLEMKIDEKTRELKRALQKEKEVVEMKSRFVSIASHEFRLPLSSIQFQTNFIKQAKKQISHDDLEKRLDAIEKQVLHMGVLLDDVLTYGKSETDKFPLALSNIVVADFLDKIIEEVSNFSKTRTHTITTEYTFMPVAITTDERLLRSILINLLTNAIKFSPEKKNVLLTGKGSGNQVIISIRDEGIGIPENEIKEIFEPFLRGKSAAAIQGTGLGLAIVKKSIELLKGEIHTKSEVGRGATFTIIIPAKYDLTDTAEQCEKTIK
jgi:PAS domain S-box-containing protein